jgi:hypothetical protein
MDDSELMALAAKKIAALRRENNDLRNELALRRSAARPTRYDVILDRAYRNARKLLHYRYSRLPCDRRFLAEVGMMTTHAYGWALGLLRLANLHNVDLSTEDALAEAIDQLDAVVLHQRTYGSPKLDELRYKAGKRYSLPKLRR